jgi:hypothetical protein
LRLTLIGDIQFNTEEFVTLTECDLDNFRITSSRNDGVAALKYRTSDFEPEATGRSGNEPNK